LNFLRPKGVSRARKITPDLRFKESSVADSGCLSRIPEPKTATKERGEKFFCSYFFCSHKVHKIEYYFIFATLKANGRKYFINVS
jgi:hypothetical protein